MARRTALCSVLAVALASALLPSAPVRAQAAPTLDTFTVNFFPESPWARVNICVGEQREIVVGVTRYIYALYSDGSVSTVSETQYLPGIRLQARSSDPAIATVAPARASTGTGSARFTISGVHEGTSVLVVETSGSLRGHVPPAFRNNSILNGPLGIAIKVRPCRYRVSGAGTYHASVISGFMQLMPTYVDTDPSAPRTESGELFGMSVWAGPCASVIVLNFPDARVTVEVFDESVGVGVGVIFPAPTSATQVVSCPGGAAQSSDTGTPDAIGRIFPTRGATRSFPHATGTALGLQGTFTLTVERIEQA